MPLNTQRIDPEFLLHAYASGVFPMAMDDGEIGWFSPDPRGIIPLDTFKPPHGMKRVIENPPFEIRIDTAFEDVMRGCADRDETWINESIIDTYSNLASRGYAHSVEAWEGDELVGGLYGVSMGAAFFGESMFSRRSEASKLCLVALVARMRERDFKLLDTQWTNPHLEKFGAIDIPKSEYMEQLSIAIDSGVRFVD